MTDNSKRTLSRRDALKIIAAAGTVALMAAPDKWAKPIVQLGALPAHAQTSISLALTCPPDTQPLDITTAGSFSPVASVQVSPATSNVSMTYAITLVNSILNTPSANGTVLTDGSGVASLNNIDVLPDGTNGSITVTWSFTNPAVGTGTCDTTYSWFTQEF